MTSEPEILFERRGTAGIVTLNRPKALNAVTLIMVRALRQQRKGNILTKVTDLVTGSNKPKTRYDYRAESIDKALTQIKTIARNVEVNSASRRASVCACRWAPRGGFRTKQFCMNPSRGVSRLE